VQKITIREANGRDLARHILEAYVIQAYQRRELGTAQRRRLLGLETRYEFEDFLAAHNVPRNYTLADPEHDRQTARLHGLSSPLVNPTCLPSRAHF
jgi:hypothetical protein